MRTARRCLPRATRDAIPCRPDWLHRSAPPARMEESHGSARQTGCPSPARSAATRKSTVRESRATRRGCRRRSRRRDSGSPRPRTARACPVARRCPPASSGHGIRGKDLTHLVEEGIQGTGHQPGRRSLRAEEARPVVIDSRTAGLRPALHPFMAALQVNSVRGLSSLNRAQNSLRLLQPNSSWVTRSFAGNSCAILAPPTEPPVQWLTHTELLSQFQEIPHIDGCIHAPRSPRWSRPMSQQLWRARGADQVGCTLWKPVRHKRGHDRDDGLLERRSLQNSREVAPGALKMWNTTL